MKLDRLSSHSSHRSLDSAAVLRPASSELALPAVDALASIAGDRQRSLQQEINEFQAQAISPFDGGERILEDARVLAAELSALRGKVEHLMKAAPSPGQFHTIDEQA